MARTKRSRTRKGQTRKRMKMKTKTTYPSQISPETKPQT